MQRVTRWLRTSVWPRLRGNKWFQRLLWAEPTSSRWGQLAFWMALSLFFLALCPALYSIYLSWEEGNMTPSWVGTFAAVMAMISGVLGVLVFPCFLIVGLRGLFSPNPNDAILSSMNEKLTILVNDVDKIKDKLGIEETKNDGKSG